VKRKYGRFKIHRELVEKGTIAPQELKGFMFEVMGKVIVLRAEHRLATDEIEYEAYSEEFDEIEFGMKVPEYTVAIYTNHDEGGEVSGYSVGFKKMEA